IQFLVTAEGWHVECTGGRAVDVQGDVDAGAQGEQILGSAAGADPELCGGVCSSDGLDIGPCRVVLTARAHQESGQNRDRTQHLHDTSSTGTNVKAESCAIPVPVWPCRGIRMIAWL